MSDLLSVNIDFSSLQELERRLRNAGNQAPHVIRRAVNHVGDKALTVVKRALVKQTGVKYGAVAKALKVNRANYGGSTYTISASGKHLALRDFGARQTKKGVSAAPWGRRLVFPHTFVARSLGGRVFIRMGKGRLPIRQVWGPSLPVEMVKADTAAAFIALVEGELPRRVEHELAALLAGHAPRG